MQIDKNTPKTHLKLIKSYCSSKNNHDFFEMCKADTEKTKLELSEAYRKYTDSGEIDGDMVTRLFMLSNFAVDISMRHTDARLEQYNKYISDGKELEKRGYNLDQIMALYKDNPSFIYDLMEDE